MLYSHATGVVKGEKLMNIEFKIQQKEEYEYEFSFIGTEKSENLSINVKAIAENTNKKILLDKWDESYRNILISEVDKIKKRFGDCQIYDFDDILENFITKTLHIFIFFYQKTNNKQKLNFKPGDSLSINDNDFSINLILINYPVFWNKWTLFEIQSRIYPAEYVWSNTDDKFFLTEISKSDNDIWKLVFHNIQKLY